LFQETQDHLACIEQELADVDRDLHRLGQRFNPQSLPAEDNNQVHRVQGRDGGYVRACSNFLLHIITSYSKVEA
jgi:hypothetical protein